MRKICTALLLITITLSAVSLTACIPAAFVVGATAGGALIYDRRSLKVISEDQTIVQTARFRIRNDSALQKTSVHVAVFDGIILLTGEVRTDTQKQQVQEIVEHLPHVKRIYNEIEIAIGPHFGEFVDDSWITTKVKSMLLEHEGFKTTQLKIVTDNNIVYIMGLSSRRQCQEAAEIASRVSGVRRVVKVCEYES